MLFAQAFLYSELRTIPNGASGSNDGSAKHQTEQKVNAKTDAFTHWALNHIHF